MHSPSPTSTATHAEPRTLLGITQTNEACGEFLRLTEMHDGTFILLTQNKVAASSFTFAKNSPDEVQAALRELQAAMRKSNVDGGCGGINNTSYAN